MNLRVVVALVIVAHPALARTLEVGVGKSYQKPSQAAAVAQDGDRILIGPGEYFDCTVWHQNNLTIEGTSEEATVITDTTCQGKALFVVSGAHVTIRSLTLTRARVPDGNGAGIRAEGQNLLVEHVRFVNYQNGILAGDKPESTITVRNSTFTRNGACDQYCAHGIYVGHIASLRVEDSIFRDTRQGHNIKSRALLTEVLHCDIADGPTGTASYAIDIPNGGSLVARGNAIEKGPNAQNRTAVIMIGEEGVTQPTHEITVENNTVSLDGSYSTVFVYNITATEANLHSNRLADAVKSLHGDGNVN